MPSNFTVDKLPEWLIIKTFTKMSPKEFMKFQQTNKQMYNLCNSRENLYCFTMGRVQFASSVAFLIRSRIAGYVSYEEVKEVFPFRIRCQELSFHVIEDIEERMGEFVKLIRERQIICDRLSIGCELTNVEEQLKWCIKTTRPLRLFIGGCDDDINNGYNFMSRQIFPVSLFDNVTCLEIHLSDYGNEDLFLLKPKEICMEESNITSYGINQLLRQWFENEREIEKIHLRRLKSISKEEVIEDLTVCVVYTKEWHQYSHLSHMDPSELPDDMPSFYHLIRAGDLDGMLRLRIENDWILIELCNRRATYYHMAMIS